MKTSSEPDNELSFRPPADAALARRLTLIGTVHGDPRGHALLSGLLASLRPDLILVELSPFGLAYRAARRRFLERLFLRNLKRAAIALRMGVGGASAHPRIAPIFRQISIPFEYLASAEFARRTKARLVLADSSEFSKIWVQTWLEMIAEKNLRVLLSLPSETADPIAAAYARAAAGIGGSRFPAPLELPNRDEALQEREYRIAVKVRTALGSFRPEKPVYIGGWQHLVPGGRFRALRDILGISRSQCLLLDHTDTGCRISDIG
jgi:hypothetical protein